MKSERGALFLSAAGALLVGCVGILMWRVTGSDAILLDGLFNIIFFLTALFTVKVSRLVFQPDDEAYPFGYAYFEPLVNGLKGALILGVSLLALFGSLAALASGGREIAAGAAIGYGVFATTVCGVLAFVLRRTSARLSSPLVDADAKNWLVNAAISAVVALAFVAIPVMQALGFDAVVPYVDPGLVAAVVLLTLSVPVRMAWQALMQLVNRSPPPEIRNPIIALVKATLSDLEPRELYVRVLQAGRTRYVAVHLVLPEDFPVTGLPQLDAIRARLQHALSAHHPRIFVDLVFTADPRWAAPATAP